MMTEEAAAMIALDEARRLAGDGAYDRAVSACDRALAALGTAPAPLLRATETAVRLSADPGWLPDPTVLQKAAETLVAHGQWDEAATACAELVRQAVARGDLPGARQAAALGMGCVEAAGARLAGPTLLRRLAEAEIGLGEPARAVPLLDRALDRLARVGLLGARLGEAQCLELLGDAQARLGAPARAAESWREAAARQDRLDRPREAARIRAKLSGM